MAPSLSVREIAAHVNGSIVGDPERTIGAVASPAAASRSDLIFIDSPKHLAALNASRAGAAILPAGLAPPPEMAGIQVAHPLLAMARAIDLLAPPRRLIEGVSPHAALGRNVTLADGVGVGACASIGDDVAIGRDTEIHPGATIGARSRIGASCVIHAGVHIYHDTVIGDRVVLHSGVVIGADGFGFLREASGAGADEPHRHRKIRQVGRVVIEDDVEIGANSAVDRATFDETRIGRGTKIDNLVTIGHNCRIGRHCLIVGQAGVSGSTTLGDYVTVAGQAGITGHLTIGTGAVIGSQAGVTKDVGARRVVLGSPAFDAMQAKKALSLIHRLPQFMKTLGAHGRRIARLEGGDTA